MRFLPTILITVALGGCTVDRSTDVPTSPPRKPEVMPATTPPISRPVALMERDPITIMDMRERLLEAAGGEIIREMRLEHALRARLEAERIELADADIESEEIRLLAELDDDPDVAHRLLQVLKNAEGLGNTRYRGLLWRNAALRALVQSDVMVDAEAMRLVWKITHGPRVRVRVIVVPSFSRAASVVEQLNEGEDFTRLAVDWSIDSSRDRGGLLDPFSTVDPSYPTALCQAIDSLETGGHTNPVLLGDRYLVARLEERLPADGMTYESLEAELHAKARQSQERMLMQEEAYRLRNEPDMRLFDGSLETSFKATTPEQAAP
ncbi:MAG: hypothetical protein VX527_03820 [Planctomycetota bacterium]|nr:hypothetical protein [Planctomycetota bacterium]